MKKIRLLLLLLLFSCHKNENKNTAVNKNVVTTDSLLNLANDFTLSVEKRKIFIKKAAGNLLNESNTPVARQQYLKLAGRFFNVNDFNNYIKTCNQVYKMSVAANDTLYIAKSLSYIGDYYYGNFVNDSAYYYYSKSEKAYFYVKDNYDVVRIKFWKANILFHEKNFSGCEAAVVKVLRIAKQKKDLRLIYDCYITLGNALDGLNNVEESLVYFKKAFEITDRLKNESQYLSLKAQAYNYIGKLYIKKREYETAKSFFEKALNFSDFKNVYPLMYANLISNKAWAEFKLGQTKGVLNNFNEALSIRITLDNKPGIVSSKINLSEYYFYLNDTLNAFKNCYEAKKIAHKNRIFEDELKSLELLSKIQPQNESQYIDRYIKLTDSLQNIERATRNKFARIEFETDEILSQKNNIEAEKDQISSQRWYILITSLIVIAIVILFYITRIQLARNKELQFEKQQQEANEEIYRLMLNQQTVINEVRQNEKKRISQELHDGVMSKLTSTRLNLFILSKKNDEETIKKCLKHIDEIQNIEKEIRSISHDLNKDSLIEKDSFKHIILDLFEQYKEITEITYKIDIENSIVWKKIDNFTKMHLYRIVQESIQNIHKYAQATTILLKINNQHNVLNVEINDDGKGFDVEKTREGIGLKNMQSRVKAMNGEFAVHSSVGQGTKISIKIPLKK